MRDHRSGDRHGCAVARGEDAFTIVELLVVIAIVSVLTALLLAAVQASREAARRVHCASHVKQLGLAVQQHVSAHGRYPSNGWGYRWVGVPDRGTGIEQPGGWIYNVLGYLEQGPLRKLGCGLPVDQQEEVDRAGQSGREGAGCRRGRTMIADGPSKKRQNPSCYQSWSVLPDRL